MTTFGAAHWSQAEPNETEMQRSQAVATTEALAGTLRHDTYDGAVLCSVVERLLEGGKRNASDPEDWNVVASDRLVLCFYDSPVGRSEPPRLVYHTFDGPVYARRVRSGRIDVKADNGRLQLAVDGGRIMLADITIS